MFIYSCIFEKGGYSVRGTGFLCFGFGCRLGFLFLKFYNFSRKCETLIKQKTRPGALVYGKRGRYCCWFKANPNFQYHVFIYSFGLYLGCFS